MAQLNLFEKQTYLANNPDLETNFNVVDPATGKSQSDLFGGDINAFAEAHYNYAVNTPEEVASPDRNLSLVPVAPQTGITQEQLAEEIAKLPAPVVQGGSSTTITGPTQEQILEAFKQAQDTSGIMGAIGTPTAGVDTPATGLYQPLEGLQAQVGQQATDTQAATGLFQPLGNIESRIGQAAIPGTTDGEAVAPTGLFAGQAGIMSRVGQAGTASAPATGLFAGQAGLA